MSSLNGVVGVQLMPVTSGETRKLLCRHGECAKQKASDWAGPFELPEPLRAFYSEVGPVDIWSAWRLISSRTVKFKLPFAGVAWSPGCVMAAVLRASFSCY